MATKKTQFNTKKPKSGSFADFLYKDRFYNNKGKKKVVNKKSVVEYSGLSALQEKIDTNKRVELDIENDTNLSVEKFKNLINSYIQILNSLDYSLSIPPRVPFSNIKKEHYKYVELAAFSYWKSTKGDLIFERNLETWRQFWITCERATIIAQVIDSRNPNLFFNNDICKAFPNKKHLALCNKSDLIVNDDSLKEFFTDIDYLTYSSKSDDNFLNLEIIIDSKFKELLDDRDRMIGMIGYPNVGKSSTINMIFKNKKVSVSSTPGKTKHLQTVNGSKFTLLDCPGLVFPKHSKLTLLFMGVINSEQIYDLMSFEKDVLSVIGIPNIIKAYNLDETKLKNNDILDLVEKYKGVNRSRCLKMIITDFALGQKNFSD